MNKESGEVQLQKLYGTTKQALAFYDKQRLPIISETMKSFIRAQTMVFISTAGHTGDCHSSFRSGPEGFAEIIDDKTLALPEYSGNGVMASLGKIIENPHIGLLFIDFEGNQVGLHVNGSADVLTSHDFYQAYDISKEEQENINGRHRRAIHSWIVIHVQEAYIHCSKNIPRLVRQGACHAPNDVE